jgi:hypothetical protein
MPEKPVGWRKEPARHGLAAKGIKTVGPRPAGFNPLAEEWIGRKMAPSDVPQTKVRYPEVHVRLSKDENVVTILGKVRMAMRDAGVGNSEIDAFTNEAIGKSWKRTVPGSMSDYDHLINTAMRWVHLEGAV